jgi:sulfur-oxidizing protein SoxY
MCGATRAGATDMSTRRVALHQLAAGSVLLVTLRPAQAADAQLEDAVTAWAAGSKPREGRITIDIAPLVDNGNAVPITLRIDSPMTAADHVREIALFNERNPQRDIARWQLGPANGRADVSTRIRLSTTQQLAAVARMSDGSVWQRRVDVIVTLAACVES